jgi:hypothetical protein
LEENAGRYSSGKKQKLLEKERVEETRVKREQERKRARNIKRKTRKLSFKKKRGPAATAAGQQHVRV